MALRKILKSRCTIVTLTAAEDALAEVHASESHLILFDTILPGVNGLDVLAALEQSEDTHNIPVIITTGSDSDEDEERGFLLGAVDYIKRPFKNAVVLARVNTQVHIVRQTQTIGHLSLMDGLAGITNRCASDIQL